VLLFKNQDLLFIRVFQVQIEKDIDGKAFDDLMHRMALEINHSFSSLEITKNTIKANFKGFYKTALVDDNIII
jgi:hypothetical protein